MTLNQATVVISGGSRGIGEAIALRCARDGANVALLAKSAEENPNLPGTVHSVAAAAEAAGGRALPLVGDIRDDDFVVAAVRTVVERFGGVDVVINNASAIDLSSSETISMRKYDLMHDINARGAFLLARTAIPHLRASANAHVLTLSPPILTAPRWFGAHTAYTMSKYAMSLVTLGLSEELRGDGIACNSLWPRTAISTAAVRMLMGPEFARHARKPEIMADAAHAVLTRPASTCTGNFFIDDEVLEEEGVADFDSYLDGGRPEDLALDAWVEPKGPHDPRLTFGRASR
ncbi:NAD(P)-dependent oxidoreductase [Pseudonocardia xishanensis]|uniref:NAD(P)-dependent oxidoreductase n=1 Tax=Pseudonocardia xishanensis TaxID=630995 RepID=A0ABP8RZZ3_9PSEU